MKQKIQKKCDICEDTDSTSLCSLCISYFCDKCFKFIHEDTKKREHKKEDIDYNVPIVTYCPEHKKNLMNLFCTDEKGNIYLFIIIYSALLCLLLL